MSLLELIFPKTCVGCGKFGSYLCGNCVAKIEYLDHQICAYCYKQALSGRTHPYCKKKFGIDGVVSLAVYKNPIQELIKSLKYRYTSDLLKEFSYKFKFDNKLVTRVGWIVVPIPLHRERANRRGFNQALLLGEIVAKKFSLTLDDKLLARKSKTSSQVGLSQKQRTENVRSAFSVERQISGENYFVFDDVWTSGATFKEAVRELKKAGAGEVWGLTLAHPR